MAKNESTKVKGVKEALAAVKKAGAKKAPAKAKAVKKKAAKKAPAKTRAKAKKAPAKKAAKAPAKKAAPKQAGRSSSGQGGTSLDLPIEKISAKEMRVVDVLNGAGSGTREIWTIADLAAAAWKSKSRKQANSWVRNSLRRLIREIGRAHV